MSQARGHFPLMPAAPLVHAICFIFTKCLTMQGSHDALWCRTRAKQEADAADDLQRDLARIEELTVEIRCVSCYMFRFSIVAFIKKGLPGFTWFILAVATCALVFAFVRLHMQQFYMVQLWCLVTPRYAHCTNCYM